MDLSTTAYAQSIGCHVRSLRRYIARGMPGATRGRSGWRIDPDQAEPWLREQAPQLFTTTIQAPTAPAPSDNGHGQGPLTIDRHIQRLDAALEGLITLLCQGTINPQLIQHLKVVSTELRLLQREQREMRIEEEQLMQRSDHRSAMTEMATLVLGEINTLTQTSPEAALAKLDAGGIKITAPKKALRLLTAAMEGQVDHVKARIADAIQESTIR